MAEATQLVVIVGATGTICERLQRTGLAVIAVGQTSLPDQPCRWTIGAGAAYRDGAGAAIA
ncbi:MAG TPA: hypothetical protein VMF86_12220 [Stellaceae bacterium]|nr:hypothetical protein [Stellaceae bacterium]